MDEESLATLEIEKGEGHRKVFRLGNDVITLCRGSESKNTIAFADQFISRRHAEIWYADGCFFIRDLRAMGCRFALDDFGSGLSSFSYLKNLPVDYLKIDGAFVRGIADDPVNRTLVGNINDIGHLLGKRTIAEYAEDAPTLRELEQLGVDFAQGFAIHRPEPLENLLDYF